MTPCESTSPRSARPRLAGRWLEPRGDPRPRGMAAGPTGLTPGRGHRTRLTGRLPLLSAFSARIIRRLGVTIGGVPIGQGEMQDRLNQNDVTTRVNVEDPVRVRDAILGLFAARFPGVELTPLACAFDDFKSL